jgi:peptide/nickel transport system substrate-binding protein
MPPEEVPVNIGRCIPLALVALVLLSLAIPASAIGAETPKRGGVLNLAQAEDPPQGFSVLETSTISVVWPSSPCFNNLVRFDPAKRLETADSIIGDLAEKWSWQNEYRNLVFFLRKGVKWHDGRPFTSKDVKFTFDTVREAPDAQTRLRVNPRKDWYANVEAIEAADPHTVVFRLKRPQPGFLTLLASHQSPVFPAHVPIAEQRTKCVGTGPFKLKEWRRNELIEYVRNPGYFVPGRPYLDGLRYYVVTDRGTRAAALQAGRLDVASPGDTTPNIAAQLKAAVPGMVLQQVGSGVVDTIYMSHARPPFNDVRVRRALSLALDRQAFITGVARGAGMMGAPMAPPPIGSWGITQKDLVSIYGKPEEGKARAKKLMSELGHEPSKPLRIDAVTRTLASYVDLSSWVISELRPIGMEINIKQLDAVQWYSTMTRRDFTLAIGVSGIGLDEPDAVLVEHFTCTSGRNYVSYCNEQVDALIDKQSRELDPKKRKAIVADILKQLEQEAARPIVAWRMDHYAHWPHVKGLTAHHSIYNYSRMQDVWLAR